MMYAASDQTTMKKCIIHSLDQKDANTRSRAAAAAPEHVRSHTAELQRNPINKRGSYDSPYRGVDDRPVRSQTWKINEKTVLLQQQNTG